MNPATAAGDTCEDRSRPLKRVMLLLAGTAILTSVARINAQEDLKPDVRNWPMFRGSPQLTGVVHGSLPQRLEVRWKFEVPDAITSSAAIADGVVYVGCDDGLLYALNLATGRLKWTYQAKAAIKSSPTVRKDTRKRDSTVYFGDDEGVLHAVDARTGQGRWTFQTDGQIISSANHDADRLVLGSYDGFVYCISPRDGTLLWKFETQGRVHGTPGITDGHVLVAGCDEYLHVLRLTDGSSVTKVNMRSVSGASAAIGGRLVYVGTYGGHVLGIDWKSGRIEWTFHDPDRQFPYLSSAAVTERAVIVGSRDKRLRAFNAETGQLLWTFTTRGRIDSSPVVAGNRVFVGSSDGNLYAVDVRTGGQVWRFETGGPITASPAVANESLVIGTEDGMIYCFGAR